MSIFFFFFCGVLIKWLLLPKKHENNGIEVITDKFSELWLN